MIQTNIIVDATGNARIVDFGLATVVRDSNSFVNIIDNHGITVRYTAPEILKNVGLHSKESDIFSFGMVMIEVRGDEPTPSRQPHPPIKVFTGNIPFRGSTPAAAAESIIARRHPKRPTHPSFTDRLWALAQRCWKQEPRDRPRMGRLIQQLSVFRQHIFGDASPATLSGSSGTHDPAKLYNMAESQPSQELINNIDKEGHP